MNFEALGFSDGWFLWFRLLSTAVTGIRYSGKDDVIDRYPQPHELYGYMLRNNTVTLENGTLVDVLPCLLACLHSCELAC